MEREKHRVCVEAENNVDLKDGAQTVRLGIKSLYLLSHLSLQRFKGEKISKKTSH